MSSGLEKFEKNMNALAAAMERTPRDVVAASARAYTTGIRSSINSVTNGGRLRGVGKKGARVGVKYTLFEGASPTAIVQATGPLQLIERDTKPHLIPRVTGSRRLRTASGRLSKKRESTGRNVNGTTVLFFNNRYVTGPIGHPGTRGKHPFEKGVNRVEVTAVAAAVTAFTNEIRSVFK